MFMSIASVRSLRTATLSQCVGCLAICFLFFCSNVSAQDKTKPAGNTAKPATPSATTAAPSTAPKTTTAKPASTPAASAGTQVTKAPVAEKSESEVLDVEAYLPKPIDTLTAPTTIAFGSCNRLSIDQNMWDNVAANNPNLWIWLGDIIYADTYDKKALAAHYKRLKTNPGYKKVRAKTQIVGVYDDHDYGSNDACSGLPGKKASKKCLMDFLDVPANASVRKRDGAYQSYTFGKGAQRIKVIVMDTRYFRDTLYTDPTGKTRYTPNTTGTVLGEAQWKWLENELRNSQANLNILCSSVQVLADEHGHEKWGNFPNERKRLLNLLNQTKPKNLMILSGDRHMAEISKVRLPGMTYDLYDFTSSGLTHIRSGNAEPNKLRVGDMILQRNFGVLKVAWNADKPVVTMQVRGLKNDLFQEVVVRY
jgi:alkaline phosphatase D